MTVLDRYIAREFSKLFLVIMASFIALYLIIDFFGQIRMLLSNKATLSLMATYFFFGIPMIISITIPAVVLLAALMLFGTMSRHSEIVAMKANGISLYRTSLPVIVITCFICILAFLFSEFITPQTNRRAEYIRLVEIQKRSAAGTFKQNQIWYRGRQGIYNFKMFDPAKNILQGITINDLSHDMDITMRIDAERAEWKDGKWIFHNLLITSFDRGAFPSVTRFAAKVIPLPEKPSDFKAVQEDAEKMGYLELRKYIEKIRQDGYDASRYLVDMYGKIAFSCLSLILAVIGISFSLRSERSGGITQSMGAGIIIGFSYWFVYAFSLSLGRSGTLPPLLSAWVANVLFGTAAVLLLLRVKT
jgi:lipopolysaccharide export system permease protein